MPYPIALVVGAALSAVGTGAQMAGQMQAKRSMQSAQSQERARQQKFQAEADTTFQKSLKESDVNAADTSIQSGAARRKSAYDQMARTSLGQAVTSPTTTGTTAGAASRASKGITATNNAWSKLVSGAQAKMGGYEDWGLNQDIKNTRARQDLAITSTNARRSADVLGTEMDVASHAGDGLNAWGQLTSALGSISSAYGATTPAKPALTPQTPL